MALGKSECRARRITQMEPEHHWEGHQGREPSVTRVGWWGDRILVPDTTCPDSHRQTDPTLKKPLQALAPLADQNPIPGSAQPSALILQAADVSKRK